MNAVRQKRRCNRSLITDRPEKPALAECGQLPLTVARKSAVTMRRGGPTVLPGAEWTHRQACDAPPRPGDRTAARSRPVEDRPFRDRPAANLGISIAGNGDPAPRPSRRCPGRDFCRMMEDGLQRHNEHSRSVLVRTMICSPPWWSTPLVPSGQRPCVRLDTLAAPRDLGESDSSRLFATMQFRSSPQRSTKCGAKTRHKPAIG